jgi:polynucleotide 5'-hydroxyl-kinase GRC3/NOL9
MNRLAVSAFAARQMLWGTRQKEETPPETGVDDEGETSAPQDTLPNRPAAVRKRKTQRPDELPSSIQTEGLERPSGRTSQQANVLPELSSDGVQEYVSSPLP